ncbi:MAG: nuclear transport factor 2 family protein [Flavobacterium sp.]|uniref:YybH family protein n=1 Tax=Flavobacterium sp. TaxID=239 RepID=UPI0012164BE0|nr:nuclear transport factor 2 family protein [Flavobacterium sp.]RZJ66160.1 MAG: nuclear transport factor 2 family protein [Flavobacterium sp.]
MLNESNANLVTWFNAGKIDSVVSLYAKNSVVVPPHKNELRGHEQIKAYYQEMYDLGFRMSENKSKSIEVTDTVAIDRGVWAGIANGKISGVYLTQWKLVDGKWLIWNEMTGLGGD